MNFECAICTEIGDARGTEENCLCAVHDCGHVFHEKCFTQWKSHGNKTCPTCRLPAKRVMKLYGSTVEGNSEGGPGGQVASRTVHNDSMIHDLFTTLNDDFEAQGKKLRHALDELRRRDRRSNDKDLRVFQLKDQLDEKIKEIEDKDQLIATKNQVIATLTKENSDKDEKIEDLQRQIKENQVDIQTLERIISIIELSQELK